MSKGKLKKNEVEVLKENPYVKNVTENRIIYTDEFKSFFMNEYLKGEKPTKIFTAAGFDSRILGPKRIERAAARWRMAYKEGKI